jgi:hypothetical protein
MNNQEKVFYDSKNIKITNTRAIFHNTTYALANIASVKIFTKPPSQAPVALLVIGGILLGSIGACILSGDSNPGGYVLIVLGLVAIGLGIYISTKLKPDYLVRISSSSGEVDALKSREKQFIERIVNAINQAIIERG